MRYARVMTMQVLASLAVLASGAAPLSAQIDSVRAHEYFAEAAELCAREGGRIWGVSLCGPMAFADPVTKQVIGNRPLPEGPRPPMLGYANAAAEWGGDRWSLYVWRMLPANNPRARRTLLIHELVHRIQPQLGLAFPDASADHLDTVEGRYWMQLEWRALAAALADSGAGRAVAIRDALAFRARRQAIAPGAAESERVLELNEGLPQYTGTVVANPTAAAAIEHAIAQLGAAPRNETFVRTFPYPSGAAYGLLLDAAAPGWTRRVRATDDLARLLVAATGLSPAADAGAAAQRYGGAELRTAEEQRDAERQARIAELRRRFVDGPVLILPVGNTSSFTTDGLMSIPGEGTVYPTFRATGEWGRLEGAPVMMSVDRAWLIVPAPASTAGRTLSGEGWTVEIAAGWSVRPGERAGDVRLVRDPDVEEARP